MGHHVSAHARLYRIAPQRRLRRTLAGSSIPHAESCSLSLRSIGFLQRCSPPRLAATQLRLGYQLVSWFRLCRVSHPAGLCSSTAHQGPLSQRSGWGEVGGGEEVRGFPGRCARRMEIVFDEIAVAPAGPFGERSLPDGRMVRDGRQMGIRKSLFLGLVGGLYG
jgi:hypothetical protein